MSKHQLDEDGEHDEDECYQCLLGKEVQNDCRCGRCCRALIIEVLLEDAEREPKIAERGSPIYTDPRLTESGQKELEGYLLNGPSGPCVFLDENNLCSIYETRPLACRLFNCHQYEHCELVELGIIQREEEDEEG
jgi:Fe-S-cluster containining protein